MPSGESAQLFARSVERGVQRAVGLIIIGKAAAMVGAAFSSSSHSGWHLAANAVMAACVTIAASNCLRCRASWRDQVLCLTAMVLAFTHLPADLPAAGAADSPIIHLAEPLLLAIAIGQARYVVTSFALTTALYLGLRTVTGGSAGALAGLQECLFIVGVTVAAAVLVTELRSAAGRATEALRRHEMRRERAQALAEPEASALIHDDLVPTLMALSHQPDAPQAPARAAAALQRLQGQTEAADGDNPHLALLRGLSAIVDDSALTIDLQVVLAAHPVPIPRFAVEALLSATGEAIRNVERHSGQSSATITVNHGAVRARIKVIDQGRGFQPGHLGVGLRRSVIERMQSVGGRAWIRSRSSSGTRVRLSWARPGLTRLSARLRESHALMSVTTEDLRRTLRRPCLALGAGYLTSAALLAPADPPWTSIIAAAAIAAILWRVVGRIRSGPPRRRLLLLAALGPLPGLAVALTTLPPASIGGLDSWIIEFSALPLVALAFVVPVAVIALLLVPAALVIGGTALHQGYPWHELPHIGLSQPITVLFVASVAGACRTAGRHIVSMASDGDLGDRHAKIRALLGARHRDVVELLSDIAAGQQRPVAASRVARAVRDCLYLPGADHADLREVIDALRHQGVAVELIVRDRDARSSPVAHCLELIAPEAAEPRSITVSLGRDESTLVLVPALSTEVVAEIEEHQGQHDHGWQVIDESEATVLIIGPTAGGTPHGPQPSSGPRARRRPPRAGQPAAPAGDRRPERAR